MAIDNLILLNYSMVLVTLVLQLTMNKLK